MMSRCKFLFFIGIIVFTTSSLISVYRLSELDKRKDKLVNDGISLNTDLRSLNENLKTANSNMNENIVEIKKLKKDSLEAKDEDRVHCGHEIQDLKDKAENQRNKIRVEYDKTIAEYDRLEFETIYLNEVEEEIKSFQKTSESIGIIFSFIGVLEMIILSLFINKKL